MKNLAGSGPAGQADLPRDSDAHPSGAATPDGEGAVRTPPGAGDPGKVRAVSQLPGTGTGAVRPVASQLAGGRTGPGDPAGVGDIPAVPHAAGAPTAADGSPGPPPGAIAATGRGTAGSAPHVSPHIGH